MAPLTQEITVNNAYTEASTKARRVVTACIDFSPKVSVIMPVYNVGKYLRQAVESVLNQTLREIELICVDDGSTDDSVSILREYAAKDSRVTIICQENKFAGVARNAGLAVARGEFLAFLDSDDFFAENMLERACQVAQQEKSDVVYFRYCNYDNETGELSAPRGINIPNPAKQGNIYTCNPDEFAEKRYTMCNPMPWNKLIRASLVRAENIRFQGIPASNDVYFSLLLISCAKRITLLYEHLVFYRHNRSDSLRNTRDKNPLAFWQAYKLLAESLKQKGVWSKCQTAYLSSLLSTSYWTFQSVIDKKFEVRQFFQSEIQPEFKGDFEAAALTDFQRMRLNHLSCPEIIVSLTSYPARIGTINQVIETILQQSLPADKVILWLAPEQFPNKESDLPAELLEQTNRGLTIDWYHDIRSYKKLIPTLKKYPEAIIVTIDDDNLYHPNWLKELFEEYCKRKDEKVIISHNVTRLYMHDESLNSCPAPIFLDEKSHCDPGIVQPSAFNKIRGCGGVFYPPHCLHESIFDEDYFMSQAPTSDDIWFHVCALKQGFKVVSLPVGRHCLNLIPGTQETALCRINDVPETGHFKHHLRNLTAHDEAIMQLFRDDHEENSSLLLKLAAKKIGDRLRTCRLDIRNLGGEDRDIEVSAPDMEISSPSWLNNKHGKGKMLQGKKISTSIELKAIGDGTLKILLRGHDYRVNKATVPVAIDIVNFQVDNEPPVSVTVNYAQYYQRDIKVRNGQKVVIKLTTLPHLFTPLELKALIKDLRYGGDFVRDNMEAIVTELQSKAICERLQYLTNVGIFHA